jgi:hypothetical protein
MISCIGSDICDAHLLAGALQLGLDVELLVLAGEV